MPRSKHSRRKSLKPRERRQVKLYHQTISHIAFNQLNEDDKYAFLLLGHIQHEISWLQRTAYIATRGPDKTQPERAGKVMQATLLIRLLLGKLNEFCLILNKEKALRGFIVKWYEPDKKASGEEAYSAFRRAFDESKWIQTARNKHFLHYPSLSDVRELLNDQRMEWEVNIYHAETTSNTVYATADVFANTAWYRLINVDDPIQGFDAAMDSMTQLSAQVRDLLERAIGHFVNNRLLSLENNENIILDVPHTLDSFKLPFFIGTSSFQKNEE